MDLLFQSLWIGLSKLDGINPDERVFHRIHCTYQKFNGELIITDKGIVFLKYSGRFVTSRERMHYFVFDEIHGIRTEKKGMFGNYIALDHRTLSWGNRTYPVSYTHLTLPTILLV